MNSEKVIRDTFHCYLHVVEPDTGKLSRPYLTVEMDAATGLITSHELSLLAPPITMALGLPFKPQPLLGHRAERWLRRLSIAMESLSDPLPLETLRKFITNYVTRYNADKGAQ